MRNKTLIRLTREILKDFIVDCTEQQQQMFLRMYSPENILANINDVIDNLNPDYLESALTQVETTIKRNKFKNKNNLVV